MPDQSPPALRETYDRAYYASQVQGSARSASIMVPLILELFPETGSVVDFGCGTGAWLQRFKLAGIREVLGLDGGAPDDGMLLIEPAEFRGVNLAEPIRLEKRFDLATSFEVAEHLPPSAAANFVGSVTAAADAVVFAAALPGQGGTWHVNERWPSYWADLFEAEGFEAFDLLRRHVWHDRRLNWWYSQNTLVFVRRTRTELTDRLRRAAAAGRGGPLDIVHPDCFELFRRSAEWHRGALAGANDLLAQERTERAALAARLEDMRAEAVRLAEAASRGAAHAAAAEARATQAETRAAAAEARAAQAETRAAAADTAHEAMLASTSWRATAPLRHLMRLARGGRA